MRIGIPGGQETPEEGDGQLVKDFRDFLDHVSPDDFLAGGDE